MRHLLEPICREGRLPGLGSEHEYRALLEAAGLRVTCVRETPSFYRIFEAART